MSIGFVVFAMVICAILGFESIAKFFAVVFWIGITIFNPWLIIVWIALFLLVNSRD